MALESPQPTLLTSTFLAYHWQRVRLMLSLVLLAPTYPLEFFAMPALTPFTLRPIHLLEYSFCGILRHRGSRAPSSRLWIIALTASTPVAPNLQFSASPLGSDSVDLCQRGYFDEYVARSRDGLAKNHCRGVITLIYWGKHYSAAVVTESRGNQQKLLSIM